MRTLQTALLLAALLVPATARAQGAPATVTFKARIADNGAPATGSHAFRFRIYDAASGGVLLWEESLSNVSVDNGLLAVELGTQTAVKPAFADGAEVYLEIRMDDVVMAPRVAIASVPYALSASDSKTLQGNAPSAFAAANHNHDSVYVKKAGDTVTGALTVNGSLATQSNLGFNGAYFYANGKEVLRNTDGWLRINQASSFPSGVYTPTLFRADGGAQFYGTISMLSAQEGDCMNGWFCNGYFWDLSVASILYSGLAQRSDARLKKDIRSIESGLDTVFKLRPVTFEWKDPSVKGTHYGFIAQEVQKVLPELVTENDHGYLTVETTGILPVAVEAIRELKQRNDALEKKVDDLESLKQIVADQQKQIDELRGQPGRRGAASKAAAGGGASTGVTAGLALLATLGLGGAFVRRRRR